MRKIIYLLLVTTFSLFSTKTFTQSTTMFIKALDNNGVLLDGGSTTAGHLKEIESLSYSVGVVRCKDCQPQVADYNIMMVLNPATINLNQISLKGLHLQSVDVTYHKTAATFDYYKIHMEDVIVESVQESGSSETPTISVSFLPAKIAWQFTAQKGDGTAGTKTKGGWDVVGGVEWLYY